MATTELGTYENSDPNSKLPRIGVSGTREGNKNYLDVNAQGPAFARQIDPVGPNSRPLFEAWAAPGSATSAAVWRIKKFVYNAEDRLTGWIWADGNGEYDNVYDDRVGLSYS